MAQIAIIRLVETDFEGVCLIGVSEDSELFLEMIQAQSPLPVELVHSFDAFNRADLLASALEMKFADKRLHHRWFQLSSDDIAFIQEITAENVLKRFHETENSVLEKTHPERFKKYGRSSIYLNPEWTAAIPEETVEVEKKPREKKPKKEKVVGIDKLEKMRQVLLKKAKQATIFVCRRKAS